MDGGAASLEGASPICLAIAGLGICRDREAGQQFRAKRTTVATGEALGDTVRDN